MKDLKHVFNRLTRLLVDHRSVWTEPAFVHDQLSWRAAYPRLHEELLALSDGQLRALEREEDLVLFLSRRLPDLKMLEECPIATLSESRWQAPEPAILGVSERKQRQIEGFVNALISSQITIAADQSVVDWCSGRGYLARAIHLASGARVLCLERDAGLHHVRFPRHLTFLAHDVLDPMDPTILREAHLHTALHACGDLHLSMLRQTAGAGVRALACSPCCYHFTTQKIYGGLSRLARQSELYPTRDELRLATAETTTANTLDRSLRHKELLWRVAFDLHLRRLRGIDAYSRAPSVRKSLLKTCFNSFAQSLVDHLERRGRKDFDFSPLSAPAEDELMQRAQSKLCRITRLERAQLAFRPALERWLLLDRALFLQECGYRVEIQKFCARHQTGRNHVILARA